MTGNLTARAGYLDMKWEWESSLFGLGPCPNVVRINNPSLRVNSTHVSDADMAWSVPNPYAEGNPSVVSLFPPSVAPTRAAPARAAPAARAGSATTTTTTSTTTVNDDRDDDGAIAVYRLDRRLTKVVQADGDTGDCRRDIILSFVSIVDLDPGCETNDTGDCRRDIIFSFVSIGVGIPGAKLRTAGV